MKLNKLLKFLIGLILLVVVVVVIYKVVRQTKPQEDSATLPKRMAMMVDTSTPKGWELYDKVMQFTPENLYEKINGRAEYYLAYDVVGMTFASFVDKSDNGSFIGLSIYDMGTPTKAFGVFSGERSLEALRVKLARDAYRIGASYYQDMATDDYKPVSDWFLNDSPSTLKNEFDGGFTLSPLKKPTTVHQYYRPVRFNKEGDEFEFRAQWASDGKDGSNKEDPGRNPTDQGEGISDKKNRTAFRHF